VGRAAERERAKRVLGEANEGEGERRNDLAYIKDCLVYLNMVIFIPPFTPINT